MYVDLTKNGLWRLTLQVYVSPEQKALDAASHALGVQLPVDARLMFQRSRVAHSVNARLWASGRLFLAYHRASFQDRSPSKPQRQTLDMMGSFLDELATPCMVYIVAAGNLPKDRYRPIIQLPMMRFDLAGLPFDEANGIRLAALDEDGSERLSVSMISRGINLQTQVDCSFSTTTSSRLPHEALRRAIQLRNSAVAEVAAESKLEE